MIDGRRQAPLSRLRSCYVGIGRHGCANAMAIATSSDGLQPTCDGLHLIVSLLLVVMPFVPSSFLLLVVRPGAPSSVLAPSSN